MVSRDAEVRLVGGPDGRGDEPRKATPPCREPEQAAVHLLCKHLYEQNFCYHTIKTFKKLAFCGNENKIICLTPASRQK